MSWFAGIAGDDGLGYALYKLLISGFIFGLVFKICRQKNLSPRVALLFASLISIVLSFRITLRAENFAFILFLGFIYLFEQFVEKPKKNLLLLLALTVVVWVNIHGSFVLSIVFSALYFISILTQNLFQPLQTKRNLLSSVYLLMTLIICTLVNPYGYRIFERALQISTSNYMKHLVAEWQPTLSAHFAGTPSFYFFLAFASTSLVMVLWSYKKISLVHHLIYFSFLTLSFFALRHVAYFYLAAVPILAVGIKHRSEKFQTGFGACATFLLVANIVFVSLFGNYNEFTIGTNFDAPLELDTINYLRRKNFVGPVLNSYILGDQLVYNFYSNLLVVVDSRTDLYGEQYMRSYLQTMGDRETFFKFIEDFKVRMIILTNDDFNHYFFAEPERLKRLEQSGWSLAFRSKQNMVFTKAN